MMSEELLYLLMITCMLTRVSSKEVKWTVRDTSPKLGRDLTLFCKVDNCTVDEIRRWHGGPDNKPLMSTSGISTDKTKYITSIEENGFILTILHLTVEYLNVSYTCSCGFDLDKHILYIEDVDKVDNLNKSTNGTNYVKYYFPITLVILLSVVFIVVIKRRGSFKRLREKFDGIRRAKSDIVDAVVLHADDDREAAGEFITNMEREFPNLNLNITTYEKLLPGTSLFGSATKLFKSSRFVFVFVTLNFVNGDLPRFVNDISLIETMTIGGKYNRFVPLLMDSSVYLPDLSPFVPLNYRRYLQAKSVQRLDRSFLRHFKILITSGRKYIL